MLSRRLRLVGYVRTGGTRVSAEEQRRMIQEYCTGSRHHLIGFAETDSDHPSFGFEEAMRAVKGNDGIIAMDLSRFIRHPEDRLLDLRAVFERLMHSGKALITVADGIETITAAGQANIREMLNNWSDRESISAPTKGDFESVTAGHL